MILNVQIIPAPEDPLSGARVVVIPSRDHTSGRRFPCSTCEGSGNIRGAVCLACDGCGWVWIVRAMRIDVPRCRYEEMIEYLDGLPVDPARRIVRSICVAEFGDSRSGEARIVRDLDGCPLPAAVDGQAVYFAREALVIDYERRRTRGVGVVRHVCVDRSARHHIGMIVRDLWRFTARSRRVESFALLNQTRLQFPLPAATEAVRRSYNNQESIW